MPIDFAFHFFSPLIERKPQTGMICLLISLAKLNSFQEEKLTKLDKIWPKLKYFIN